METLINAGVKVEIDIPDSTWFKAIGTGLAIIVLYFVIKRFANVA